MLTPSPCPRAGTLAPTLSSFLTRLALPLLLAAVTRTAAAQRPVTTLDTVQVTVSSRTVGTGVRSAEIITSQFAKVGIRAKIEQIEWPTWLSQGFCLAP